MPVCADPTPVGEEPWLTVQTLSREGLTFASSISAPGEGPHKVASPSIAFLRTPE